MHQIYRLQPAYAFLRLLVDGVGAALDFAALAGALLLV
jgi:hypothetical protein